MSSILRSFIVSTGTVWVVFILGILGRLIIQAKRNSKRETDFVIPHDLSLFGLSVSLGCLAIYEHFPKEICPLAASNKIGSGELFGLLLAVEMVFFVAAALMAGKFERSQEDGVYASEGYSRSHAMRIWSLVYRNALGFASLFAVAITMLLERS